MEAISPNEVRVQVRRFWQILSGGSKDSFDELYSPEATVITGSAKRGERAQLAVARRKRAIANQPREASGELGPIDVEILDNDVAVASYTYDRRSVRKSGDASEVQHRTSYGRATHVFQRDARGDLRIVHEHLSAAVPPSVEPVPSK